MAQSQFGQLKRDDSNFPVGWIYNYIPSAGTSVVKSAGGFLHVITLNKPVATSVITLYDAGVNVYTGTIASITIPASPQPVSLRYDVQFVNGLFVNVGTAVDMTISYV